MWLIREAWFSFQCCTEYIEAKVGVRRGSHLGLQASAQHGSRSRTSWQQRAAVQTCHRAEASCRGAAVVLSWNKVTVDSEALERPEGN